MTEITTYPHSETIKAAGAEILLQMSKFALYRSDGDLRLHLILQGGREKRFAFDDIPTVEKAIRDALLLVMIADYRIYADLSIKTPDGTPYGNLIQRIASAVYGGSPRNWIKQKYRRRDAVLPDGTINCRLGNLTFPNIPRSVSFSLFTAYRVGSDIEIYHSGLHKIIAVMDYSAEMLSYLDKAPMHICANSNRPAVYYSDEYGKKNVYIYELVLMSEIYAAIPASEAELKMMDKLFSDQYKDLTIDHLDGDHTNNHVSNLMLMSRSQNSKKQTLQWKLREIGGNYFVDLSSSDNEHINMSAGWTDENGTKITSFSGVYTVPEMLERFGNYIKTIQEGENY